MRGPLGLRRTAQALQVLSRPPVTSRFQSCPSLCQHTSHSVHLYQEILFEKIMFPPHHRPSQQGRKRSVFKHCKFRLGEHKRKGSLPSYVPGPLSLLCWVLLDSGRSPLGGRAQPRTQPRSPPAAWGRAFVSGSQRPHMQTTPTVPPGDLPSPAITETVPQPLRPRVALPTPHPFLRGRPSTPPPSGPFSAPTPQFLPSSLYYHKHLAHQPPCSQVLLIRGLPGKP